MHLLPTYQTVLKRQKAQIREIKDWTDESVLCLQDCLHCTDWEMLKQSCGDDLNELTDVTCSYVAFCRDMIVPRKRVRIYPNNKPWITKRITLVDLLFKHLDKMGSHARLLFVDFPIAFNTIQPHILTTRLLTV